MSKDILRIIKKHKYLYFFVLFSGFFITFYMYWKQPVEYMAQGSFKYIGPEGVVKTTKTDVNGTITYENFKPGDGGLEIAGLVESETLSVSFNGGKGSYRVVSRSLNPDIPLVEVNNFLNSLTGKNINFLKEKQMRTGSLEEKLKLQKLIENPQDSFPLIIEAKKIEVIDNRHLIIFFGIILSFLAAITAAILKERVDEA